MTTTVEIKMAKDIEDLIGTCPADIDKNDWERKEGCEKICGTDLCGDEKHSLYKCWLAYYNEGNSLQIIIVNQWLSK